MQQFIAGFVVALLAVGPIVVFFLRKKASENRRGSSEHLKQLEELSKLTGELAHEIKNPLSTIKVNLKLVSEELEGSNRNEPAGPGDKRFARPLRKINVIKKEADRLEQILDGFLRYLDRGQLQLASTDLNELVSDMVDFYLPQGRSHSITIRQGLCNGPLVCRVDADMLKQAILNLFINAQQAMSNGGELIIRTDRDKKNAMIRVSDTGSGIAAGKLADIFDAYYSTRPAGSGLGLPIAKRIVEAHKGQLSVNSEPGKGTLFTIKLPLVETN